MSGEGEDTEAGSSVQICTKTLLLLCDCGKQIKKAMDGILITIKK